MRAHCIYLALLLSQPAAARTPTFVTRVRENFASWDLNHDGRLSAGEVAQLVQSPDIRDQNAAALATLKHFSRIEVSLRLLEDYTRRFERRDPRRTPFTRVFDSYRRRIDEASRELWVGGGPHREAIRQGADGDCYFLAAIGSMLERDPLSVRRLLTPNSDGTFSVLFPGQRVLRLAAPTDAELALYDNSNGDGIWLLLLEKAYGTLRVRQNHKYRSTIEALDATGGRGSVRESLKVLTGRDPWVLRFDHRTRGENAVRDRLERALADGELVTVRTARSEPAALPFKVPHQHVWSVLDFDRSRDLVTLWNPWGNDLAPMRSGATGRERRLVEGYATRRGVMQVSMSEFYRFWWGLIGAAG
jgi:hypothetical protein